MEELERIRADWSHQLDLLSDKTKFSRELVSRLEDDQSVSLKQRLSQARDVTKAEIEELQETLTREENFLKFVDLELEKLEDQSEQSVVKDNIQAVPSQLYTQVNKASKGKHTESGEVNVGNVRTVDTNKEPQGRYDESEYEEINYRADAVTVDTAPLENSDKPTSGIKKLRGSVKETIKLFERSESSSSQSSEETLDHYSKLNTVPKEPPRPKLSPKPSPAARRRHQECAYEEIEIPQSTLTPTFSFKDKPPKDPPVTGKPEVPPSSDVIFSDDRAYESVQDTSVATAKPLDNPVVKTKPAVPLRRSRGSKEAPSINSDILKKTEETLKFSSEEPKLSSSFKAQEIKISGRTQFHTVERDSKVNIDDVEGDYCSLSDLRKHITVLNVNQENESSPASPDGDQYMTIAEKSKKTLTPGEEDLEVKEKAEEEELEKTEQEGEETDDNMKKLFTRKVGVVHSDIYVEPSSPVVGKRYKSLSTSSESEEDFGMKTVPWSITEDTKNSSELEKLRIEPYDNITPSRAKTVRKARVPDYESLTLQSLLTSTGVSAADPNNLTDTGSEDDTGLEESVPEMSDVTDDNEGKEGTETVSHNSDDSGVCDTAAAEERNSPYALDKTAKLERSDSTSINLEVDHRKISSTVSTGSRLSTASTVTVDGGDAVFLQRCDSIEAPGIPRTVYEESEKSGEDDNVSICSLDDMLDKPDGREENSSPERHRAEQLHMRHLVVKGILESEKSYLRVIDELVKAKRYLQSVAMQKESSIALEDVTIIFYMLDEIFQKHKQFVEELEVKVNNWTDDQDIGSCFKLMVFYFKLYEEYVNNYPKAIEKIHKYQEDENSRQLLEKFFNRKSAEMMDPFKDETSKLEDILLKPVQRIQRNTLVLHDLIKHTPEDHPDHEALMKALKLSEENLKTYNAQTGKIHCETTSERRQLVKNGFVVEVAKDKKATRHLRYIFLFNDVLICTKHKASSKHKEASFKYLWSFFLSSTEADIKGEKDRKYSCKESVEELKMKIGNMKAELREEMLKEESLREKAFSISHKKAARNIEKLQKKIQEQEASLVEALPHLPMMICGKDQRPHTLLFSTDYERDEWREAIETQHEKQIDSSPPNLTVHQMEALISETKQRPQVNSIGTALLKKDEEMLNGSLNVTIHKLHGLEKVCDTYCCLEMDFYGHFYKKAQTRTCENTTDPAWNQDFELELDCSQTLRILCYEKRAEHEDDVIIGKCALELSLMWLNSKFNEKTIMMNEVSITISIRHTPASKTLKRAQSRQKTGIFGVKIQNTTKRECKTVPSIVSMCVEEVERRGMEEIGIYRVSGVTSEVQHLKKMFDKNPVGVANQMGEMDIHAITGVLKLYFRELPEPLFTDHYYQSFIQTIELSDEEAKEKCMLEVLHSLPEANYYTIVYMMEHLVKVGKLSLQNKMSLNNLATIFGPTLLHPAVQEDTADPMLQIARAARDASVQCEVINFFLKFAASGKNIRKSAQSSYM